LNSEAIYDSRISIASLALFVIANDCLVEQFSGEYLVPEAQPSLL
jgi:hypothetical protein